MSQRVLVLGMGITGQSAAKFLHEQGHYILGVDRSLDALKAKEFFHERFLEEEQDFPEDIDLVVRSPGVQPSHPWVIEALQRQIPTDTDIQIAFRTAEFQRYPSLGITGSNGKTTTALFLTHLFHVLGIPAIVMGNIGLSVLNQMLQPGIRVVEISSFQLATQNQLLPVLSGATLLNFSQNHLDYHKTLDMYFEAKSRIQKCLNDKGSLWIGEGLSIGKPYQMYMEEIQAIFDKGSALKPLYLHDRNNYCAAYALANEVCHVSLDNFLKAILTFEKPPHRIEYLGEKDGVHYINDSKATTVSSVGKALVALGQKIIVILGGKNKGGDFSSLISVLTHTAKHIIVMGESQEEIATALCNTVPLTRTKNLQEAVHVAQIIAQPGDNILLSPGCASFDQFQSFEERGALFKQLIRGNGGKLL
ncbi:UDP-N-acetylmuramoyl-L-alanine--D-glutamate ligase [Candidatus Chlamydia sanziniae]|uniref:UDP-N-acetylmuramoylalanine--D-glutamate ligase n=1 Tax=Candidatus Chlamydia sanziniae TaxID=1806891 RepID=A0A1A9HUM0_9CHLA|nr:UDP-N-acetylmuramoyl-L-alanine--D-glutamate ligase [Candidatus Chlamydia sanziniae]ANH78700.1 UDP-N-acetylmuramoylalanine--D-glutamate ligase [Candidatus Chlamydia sanziniae]